MEKKSCLASVKYFLSITTVEQGN